MKRLFLPLFLLAASIAVAQTETYIDPNIHRLEKLNWNNDTLFINDNITLFKGMKTPGFKSFSTGKDSILGQMPCVIPDLSKCNYNMPNLATTPHYKAIMLERYGSAAVVKPPVILNGKPPVKR
ncbi:MAG: hypothetical protein J0L56_17865 [Chitinophagales bacterium]|nr:hypothetical protein [Chitinophagales bacterium]